MDPQTLTIVLVIAFLILSLGIHEAAHAWVAWRCGDDTARSMGRLTLNPIAHIDPFMTILLPAFLAWQGLPIFGGAKPVPVNYYNLRHPLRNMMMVAIAGPLSNFILAIIFSLAWNILVGVVGMGETEIAPRVMWASAQFNVLLAIFNMIPVPPLDGSRVMAWILPSGLRESYVSLERFGLLIVVLLLWSGSLFAIIGSVMGPALEAVKFLSATDMFFAR